MRNWEKPMVVVDAFVANEFVSACGDKGAIYKFECDAPGGNLYYYPNSDGKIDGKHNPNDRSRKLGGYTPCNKKHEAPKADVFYDGFIDYNNNGRHDDGEGVIVWTEIWHGPFGRPYIGDYHATTKLDMNSWETAKS